MSLATKTRTSVALAAALLAGLVATPLTTAAAAEPAAVKPAAVKPAAAKKGSAPALRVGTFNVRSVKQDDARVANERPWRERRVVVIKQILRERVDVLGVQEVSQNKSYGSRLVDGPLQYLDLRNGLNKAGGSYELTGTAPEESRTTRILYNRNTVSPVRTGSVPFRNQSAYANDTRYLVWAVFRHRQSGKEFFFANTHLGNKSTDLQRAQWQEVVDQVRALRGDLPVVVVGDFQASKIRQPAAAMMSEMSRAGFGDVLGQRPFTERRVRPRPARIVNGWINSVNHFKRNVADFSYEKHRDYLGNNADWIFADNRWGVRAYKTVVNMKNMRLRGVIPSDHNMVRATLLMR